MTAIRAVIIGGLSALGLPTILKNLDGPVGDFLARSSIHFQLYDTWLRWSWAVFAAATLFSFLVMLATRNR
ncbi:hypothetical protein [Sphingomonas sp. C3-2]|uniref:hypothetical protein n=1 Tax=Sphingomonas sp. C3-2 TaxID=3062169 RepID=UPI00294AF9D6|nr:hypothetical protein [Sphingomonas sp. C3-2]WOK35631.1 hypothetical protein QYC26_11480 [Sphingomonas sp. C3-2]